MYKQSDKARIITDSSVIDNNGNTIVPFGRYQLITILRNNMLCVFNNGHWGLLDRDGSVLLDCIFDNMFERNISDGTDWILILKDGFYGAVGPDGKLIADCVYEKIDNYYEDLLWVEKNNYYGVVDKKGNIVADCIYEDLNGDNLKAKARIKHNKEESNRDFLDNWFFFMGNFTSYPPVYEFAAANRSHASESVKIIERFSIIDELGKIIVPFGTYQKVQLFSDNLFIVRKNNLDGLIDKNGTVILDCIYDYIQPFSETLVRVNKDRLYGLIDTSGNIVLDCIYDRISIAGWGGETLFWNIVERNKHFGVIDDNGKFLADCVYESFEDPCFDEFLALKKDGLYVFVNIDGEVVASGIESVEKVCGILVAKKGGLYGLFDSKGNSVTDFIYDSVSNDNDSWIKVCKNGLWGLIDESGKVVVECLFDSIERKDSDTESSYTLKKKHKLFPNSDDSNSIDPSDLPF